MEERAFKSWLNNQQARYPLGLSFNEIIIPTIDSQRMILVSKLLVENQFHVLTPGVTGCGKSINANLLMQKYLTEDFISTSLVMSAQTQPSLIEENIFIQISKRKKGVYGPTQNKKLLLFVDDLNMPKKEHYGAQPPIEFFRQYLDYQSWYIWDLQKEYIKVEDLVILGAMGSPGGG